MLIYEIVIGILLGYFSIVVIKKIIFDLKKDASVLIFDYRIIAFIFVLIYLGLLSLIIAGINYLIK